MMVRNQVGRRASGGGFDGGGSCGGRATILGPVDNAQGVLKAIMTVVKRT